ncbi:DUF202 domain-containing protein [Patescibacteria group bacterium]|nr:DUF202 domain-containing protein [Patescibacteria group bacterium]
MVIHTIKRKLSGRRDQADRARDHLANERTYLAWLRTAVNVMVLGLVVAKFITDNGNRAEIAGILLVGIGFLLLIYGTYRTGRLTSELETGTFETDRGGPIVIGGLVLAGMVIAALLLFL